MATPGELIKRVADITGVAEATVTTYYRALREAGLVTKGGRGNSAARPTPHDAANLLVAIGGSRFEKQPANRIVEEYMTACAMHGTLHSPDGAIENNGGVWVLGSNDVEFNIPALRELSPHHSIIDAVAALIKAAIHESYTRAIREASPAGLPRIGISIEVSFSGPKPAASIDLRLLGIVEDAMIEHHEDMGYLSRRDDSFRGDLTITRTLSQDTIFAVAELLRGGQTTQ